MLVIVAGVACGSIVAQAKLVYVDANAPEEHTITVCNEKLHFTARPDLKDVAMVQTIQVQ